MNTQTNRRKFLISTAGAAIGGAALAALPPSRFYVWGAPNVSYTETGFKVVNGFVHKGSVSISPVGGRPLAIKFTFTAYSWHAKDYARTLLMISKNIFISVDYMGNLQVDPDVFNPLNTRSFVIIPFFSKYEVRAVISTIIVGAGTPNVNIRISFQQVIDYQEWSANSWTYESVSTERSSIPYNATAMAMLND